jgi:hypothetical protein
MYECPTCKLDPTSHSLRKIKETTHTVIFYTCPSQATKYNDIEGILSHYRGVLSEIPQHKQWIWVFDGHGFTLSHAMEVTLASKMATLIMNQFSHNLRKIKVIRPTSFISITLNIVLPFLSQRVRSLIEICQ